MVLWEIHAFSFNSIITWTKKSVNSTVNDQEEEEEVVSIVGYIDVAQDESALICAVVRQPVSVGIDGSTLDFQLYTGVSDNIIFHAF